MIYVLEAIRISKFEIAILFIIRSTEDDLDKYKL